MGDLAIAWLEGILADDGLRDVAVQQSQDRAGYDVKHAEGVAWLPSDVTLRELLVIKSYLRCYDCKRFWQPEDYFTRMEFPEKVSESRVEVRRVCKQCGERRQSASPGTKLEHAVAVFESPEELRGLVPSVTFPVVMGPAGKVTEFKSPAEMLDDSKNVHSSGGVYTHVGIDLASGPDETVVIDSDGRVVQPSLRERLLYEARVRCPSDDPLEQLQTMVEVLIEHVEKLDEDHEARIDALEGIVNP